MQTVDDHHRRRKNSLLAQIAQPLFQLRNGEAFHPEGHNKPVGENRFPKAVDLLSSLSTGKMMKKFIVPKVDLVHGIVQTDMENFPISQHAVDGKLNQKSGFSNAGMCQDGTEAADGKDLLRFETELT